MANGRQTKAKLKMDSSKPAKFESPEFQHFVLNYLNDLWFKNANNQQKGEYFVKFHKVVFSTKCSELYTETDHGSSTLFIHAPKERYESKKSLETRRLELLKEFGQTVDALKTRGFAEMYTKLGDSAVKKIEKLWAARNKRKRKTNTKRG